MRFELKEKNAELIPISVEIIVYHETTTTTTKWLQSDVTTLDSSFYNSLTF